MPLASATILSALLSLAPAWTDRDASAEERVALLEPVAEAIAAVARTPEDAAALTALAWHESRLARYVVEGRCSDGPRGARCDNGRARTPWQVHSWCRAAFSVAEPESLRAGAECALRHLHWAAHRCALQSLDVVQGMFSGYRSGSCAWSPAKERVATYRRVLRRLEAA